MLEHPSNALIFKVALNLFSTFYHFLFLCCFSFLHWLETNSNSVFQINKIWLFTCCNVDLHKIHKIRNSKLWKSQIPVCRCLSPHPTPRFVINGVDKVTTQDFTLSLGSSVSLDGFGRIHSLWKICNAGMRTEIIQNSYRQVAFLFLAENLRKHSGYPAICWKSSKSGLGLKIKSRVATIDFHAS